ncbi:MAG: hypothetical protein K2Q20_05530 [Phycisphaerales bacterium]|nr:hypothetical protein [Phycisphaerales bacterium]
MHPDVERAEYVQQVQQCLQNWLSEHRGQLAVGLQIAAIRAVQEDWRLEFVLEPVGRLHSVCDVRGTVDQIARDLNQHFCKSPWYFGISLFVPYTCCGAEEYQAFLARQKEQEADNRAFRQVRLRKDEDA